MENTSMCSDKKRITEIEENKTASSGMPVYDLDEPWVQQYIEDFGTEPNFF